MDGGAGVDVDGLERSGEMQRWREKKDKKSESKNREGGIKKSTRINRAREGS